MLWLNDRVGTHVQADVTLEKGDYPVSVLAIEGELRHWRADYPGETFGGEPREDIEGSYYVGDVSLDVTDLEHLRMWERHYSDDDVDARTLEVELGGQTGMGNEILLRIASTTREPRDGGEA